MRTCVGHCTCVLTESNVCNHCRWRRRWYVTVKARTFFTEMSEQLGRIAHMKYENYDFICCFIWCVCALQHTSKLYSTIWSDSAQQTLYNTSSSAERLQHNLNSRSTTNVPVEDHIHVHAQQLLHNTTYMYKERNFCTAPHTCTCTATSSQHHIHVQ